TTTTRPARPPVPPSAGPAVPLSLPDAEALGERIQAQAAVVAGATCQFLLMLADFDARGGAGWFVGLKSTAHWLAWACSMSPGAAREHVRVARALPSMPLTVTEFQAGRLSYSKVREISRVIDRVDEQTLVEMARAMTASQLARTISSVRAVDGTRLGQDAVRQARWQHREDGMIEVRAVLPAEMGAEVVTALELALDRDGQAAAATHAAETDEPDALTEAADATTTATLEQRKADALVALARTYLDTEPSDRTGEDRHLVIVELNADTLTAHPLAAARDVVAPCAVRRALAQTIHALPRQSHRRHRRRPPPVAARPQPRHPHRPPPGRCPHPRPPRANARPGRSPDRCPRYRQRHHRRTAL